MRIGPDELPDEVPPQPHSLWPGSWSACDAASAAWSTFELCPSACTPAPVCVCAAAGAGVGVFEARGEAAAVFVCVGAPPFPLLPTRIGPLSFDAPIWAAAERPTASC